MKTSLWLLAVSIVVGIAPAWAEKEERHIKKKDVVVAGKNVRIGRYQATVVAFDSGTKNLTLKPLDGGKEQTVVLKDTTSVIKGGRSIKADDLKEGDALTLNVEEKEGTMFARSITVQPTK